MVNNFHYKKIEFRDLNMHIMQIGWDGCNLIMGLDKDPAINRVIIRGKIYDRIKIRIIMDALRDTQVKFLDLSRNQIGCFATEYLADGLRHTNITSLNIASNWIRSLGTRFLANILKDTSVTHLNISSNYIGDDGMKYLAENLKNTNLISLKLENNGITSHGIKYLADVLQYTNLTSITLSNSIEVMLGDRNQIEDEGVIYLSAHLKQTNITCLNLNANKIRNYGVQYLSQCLKDTCITSISLAFNYIDNFGVQYLAQTLQDTQIIAIDFGLTDIEDSVKTIITKVTSQNRAKALKMQNTFQRLVAQNTETYNLEFIIPNEIENLDMAKYLYIIQIIRDEPNSKGHIFDMIEKNHCTYYPDIINKINEFVATMPEKFITFFNTNLPKLVTLLDNYDYVNLVKQFENMKFSEIVQNLLLHRVLYYVDENSEILHPYIYKMLVKYSMLLYSEHLEPNKKEAIISYYQDHREIDGAEEIINLLGC